MKKTHTSFLFTASMLFFYCLCSAQQINHSANFIDTNSRLSYFKDSSIIRYERNAPFGTGGNFKHSSFSKENGSVKQLDKNTPPPTTQGATVQKFVWTGAAQTFNVPACVTQLHVQLWGAGGGGAYLFVANSGGSGGYVSGNLAVTPGSTITIVVGGSGNNITAATTYGGGGEMGDQQTFDYDASGGGRSAVQITAGTDNITAGGGGGAGASNNSTSGGGTDNTTGVAYGGAGAYPTGIASGAIYHVTAAAGGGQVAGGIGGSGAGGAGATGSLYIGGNGAFNGGSQGGGGGGGGYYGGGGGGADNAGAYGNGGGGGSSYISNAAVSGASDISGSINTAGVSATAPNTGDVNYNAGVAVGGAGVNGGGGASTGGNGEVVITYNIFSASISSSTNTTSCVAPNGHATATQCGGTAPYTYSWSPTGYIGGATSTYSGLPAGTYTVTVTDNTGITSSAKVTITQALTATISSSTNPTTCIATNGSATVTASGTSGYTYSWSPTGYTGGGTSTYSNLPSGTYTCTVTDVNSCTATASVTINGVSDGITASITGHTDASCSGTNGSATAANGGGLAPYTYSWSPTGYTGGTTTTYSALPSGTYTCTITDKNGCSASASVTILSTFANTALSCSESFLSMCGLNYVQGSNLVETRSQASNFNINGTGLPTSVSIAGIPSNGCTNIVKAYLVWESSYSSGPANPVALQVKNPSSVVFNYSAVEMGLSTAKCWGEVGTVAYKQDVTSSISGNGTYTINMTGAGNSGAEVDGVTLLVIYQDKSKTYTGSIVLNDGLIAVTASPDETYTMSGLSICANSPTAHAFAILADMQASSNANNTETFNGTTVSFPTNFWNFCDIPTAVTAVQTTAVFNTYTNNSWGLIGGTNDCYALVLTGMYWQNSCTACTYCSPTPISLLYFQAQYNATQNNVALSWATASEINNKNFVVQKSTDGFNFENVASVPGAGNSDHTLYYNATDLNPWNGVSYYRLKQIDYDGNYKYSDIKAVNINPSNYSATIFPNPATGNVILAYSSPSSSPMSAKVVSISGTVVLNYAFKDVRIGVNNYTLNTASLAAGIYIIQLINSDKVFYLKFVKQ